MQITFGEYTVQEADAVNQIALAEFREHHGTPTIDREGDRYDAVVVRGDVIVATLLLVKPDPVTAEIDVVEWGGQPSEVGIRAARALATDVGVRIHQGIELPGDGALFMTALDERFTLSPGEVGIRQRFMVLNGMFTRAAYVNPGAAIQCGLMHGLQLRLEVWYELLRTFHERGIGAIAVDLPGHGGADPFAPHADPVDETRAFMRALVRRQARDGAAVVLVPQSALTVPSVALARHDTQEIKALALVSDSFRQRWLVVGLSSWPATVWFLLVATLCRPLLTCVAGWVFAGLNLSRRPNRAERALCSAPFRTWRAAVEALLTGRRVAAALRRHGPEALADLANATCPVVAFRSTHDAVAVPVGLPSNVEAVSLGRVGHTPMRDAASLGAKIARWLRRQA